MSGSTGRRSGVWRPALRRTTRWSIPLQEAQYEGRSFAVDVLACPTCQGRMRLLALVKDPASISRYLATVGEATEVPRRSPGRGRPYWKSRVLRLKGPGDEGGGHGSGADEVAA